ncbi:MAG: transketolase [Candidatus Poribacteria bacterium]
MMEVNKELISKLEDRATVIRRHVVKIASTTGCHIGGAMSVTDIITALYFHFMKIDPQNPQWSERDYCILSKGHTVPALYAALAERGFFPVESLSTYQQLNSMFAGHPTMKTPGIELATGSLGHGLSVGIGIAVAVKADGEENRVYVIVGDGESQEGSVWEAAMSAPRHLLDNLIVIVDYNQFQASAAVKDILPLDPLADKWKSFGWAVCEIDGNDMAQVFSALANIPAEPKKPTAIIAHTVKGKGVSFLEAQRRAHYTKLNPEETEQAYRELGKIRNRVFGKNSVSM